MARLAMPSFIYGLRGLIVTLEYPRGSQKVAPSFPRRLPGLLGLRECCFRSENTPSCFFCLIFVVSVLFRSRTFTRPSRSADPRGSAKVRGDSGYL